MTKSFKMKLKKDIKFVERPPKFRYLYPMDKAMRKQLEPLAKPYPRKLCDAGVSRSIPSVQDGGGGAVPTASLYNYA